MPDPRVFPRRPRVALPCGAILGEGAVWDELSGTLLFVDIESRRLWRWRPGEEAARPTEFDEEIGFVLLTTEPEVVVGGLRSGLARIDLTSGRSEMLVRPEPELPGNRLNDGCAGPDGSVYFGTLNAAEREATGRFYRWNGRDLLRFGPSTIVANGPAIDPVRRLLYATDTTGGRIHRYRLGGRGEPEGDEVLISFPEGAGHPDGMAIDADGHLWICHWGGSRVTRFSPEGAPVLEVPIPTAQVTKAAFGGPDLGTLYVTTAARGRDRETDPMAGHVFAIETGVRGMVADRVRLP